MIHITFLSIVSLALVSCGNVASKSTPDTPEPKPVEYLPPTELD